MTVEATLKRLVGGFGHSGWKFVTSTGVSVALGTPIVHIGINGEGGAVYLSRGRERVRLLYGGFGGSVALALVPTVVNLSFSMVQMPSAGVVYRLPYAGRSVERRELSGGCVLLEIAGDTGPGASGTMMFLGGNQLFAITAGALTQTMGYLPALLATCNAVAFFGGMTATLLPVNVAATVYIGMAGE